MKLWRRNIGMLVFLVAAACLATTASSQMWDRFPKALRKKAQIVAPPPAADAENSGAMENSVRLSQPADEQQQAVAAHFRRQATPSVRATYFSTVLQNPDFRFKRWDIRILHTAVVDGATQVRVRTTPIVASRFAAVTSIIGCLDETYQLKDDAPVLLKTDPHVDPRVPIVFDFDGD